MARRTLVALLWFVAVALTSELVWSIAATPRPAGWVLAVAVAAFVWADPVRQLHPRPVRADVVAILARDTRLASR